MEGEEGKQAGLLDVDQTEEGCVGWWVFVGAVSVSWWCPAALQRGPHMESVWHIVSSMPRVGAAWHGVVWAHCCSKLHLGSRTSPLSVV